MSRYWAIALSTILIVAAAVLASIATQPQSIGENPPMHINFERSGGFAGMRLTTTLDSDAIGSEEARELRKMIESCAFFDLPKKLSHERPGADRFQYKLTVETPDRRHTVEIDEAVVPPSLRPLLDWLTAKAKERR